MRVVIVGAGSLGLLFAAMLARTEECQVVLVGRPGRTGELASRGVRVSGYARVETPVRVTEHPEELGEADLVLFTTKAHHLREAVAATRHLRVGAVAGLQNGVMKNELLAEGFGPDKVLGAASTIGATRTGVREVDYTHPGVTWFGEIPASAWPPGFSTGTGDVPSGAGGSSERVEAVCAAFRQAGFRCEPAADILSVEWSKACNVIGSFATSVLTRQPFYMILKQPDIARVHLGLVREVAAVAAARGISVGDYDIITIAHWLGCDEEEGLRRVGERGAALERHAPRMLVSMLQDVLAGRSLEVDEVFGYVANEGRRLGVSTPYLEMAWYLLRGIDSTMRSGTSCDRTLA